MSIELKTVMGQMNIVRGRWMSKAPNILAVREPASRLRGAPSKGDLFIAVELRGNYVESEREDLSRLLAEQIRNTYYQSSGSITASLRRALLAANEQLLAEASSTPSNGNDRGDGEIERLGGATTVAVRGEEVFMASVGPAVTYTVTRGTVTQFPEASPWLNMVDPQATGAPALGRSRGLDVQLFHAYVEPGDILILGDSRFARHTSPDKIEEAVAYQGVEGALTNLGKLTGGQDCTALVVEIQARSKGPLKGQKETAVPPRTPLDREPAHSEDPIVPEASPRATTSQESSEQALASPGKTTRQFPVRIPLGRSFGAIGKGLLALIIVISTGLRTLLSRVLPGGEPGPSGQAKATTGQARRVRKTPLPQRALRTVALAIPILVLLAVLLTYWQRGLARENEFGSLVEQAQISYQQALSAEAASARELLAQAGDLLIQADAIKADEPSIGELRTAIAEQQDKIDQVERLYWIGELRSYNDPGTQPRRVIVNGLYVYVLDTGTDQVFRHQLDEVNDALEPDEGDPVLVRRGQQVDSSVVGEMIDLAWMPAGGNRQTSDLLILESGGLLEYNPSWGLAPLSIANRDAWALPVAVGSYFGNFYILDPQVGQVLRYLPSTEDYSNPAEYYFPDQVAVDLNGAVDMAIDGFIYVLYADGTIRKYEGGVPAEFQLTEIDKPLSRPTAIYTAPDDVAQFVYVADAGNGRVVQLNKDGRFLRQFKPREEGTVNFNTLRSIFVDELTGKLYLLNDHALYIANITPFE
jgi:hypothetical protein